MSILEITAVALCLLSFTGLAGFGIRLRRQQRDMQALSVRLETLSGDISALCAGAVGVDRRVGLLESQGRRLELCQETLENRQQDERPYGEAIQLVQKGTSANGLMDKLGLSQSEAELVAMLHGTRKAG